MIVLLSIVSGTIFRYVDSYQSHYQRTHEKLMRDRLVLKLRNISASRDTLYNSLLTPANSDLRNCLLDDVIPAGSTPPDCTAGIWLPVTLDRPVPLAGIQPVASNAGVNYNFEGNLCALAPASCTSRTFSVRSEFSAGCSGGAPSCHIASVISFRFTITPSADLRGMSVTVMGPSTTPGFSGLTLAPMRLVMGSLTRAAFDTGGIPVITPTPTTPDTDPEEGEAPIVAPVNPPPCPYGQAAVGGTCGKFTL